MCMCLVSRRLLCTGLVRRAPLIMDAGQPTFVNRNPRNTERLRLERKQEGWSLEPDRRNFWHRLVYESFDRHISGYVEHCSGVHVVSASSRELCVRRHLFSATDVSAAYNVGRVLAHRCLKAGFNEVAIKFSPEDMEGSEKLQKFVDGVREVGVVLEEPSHICTEPIWAKDRHLKPWQMCEETALRSTTEDIATVSE